MTDQQEQGQSFDRDYADLLAAPGAYEPSRETSKVRACLRRALREIDRLQAELDRERGYAKPRPSPSMAELQAENARLLERVEELEAVEPLIRRR